MTSGTELVLDVREIDEFKAERVPGSMHLPLSQLDALAPGLLKPLQACHFVVMCRSGNRARLATEQLVARGLLPRERTKIFEGGILEWKRQGQPTEGSSSAGRLPIMRQVQVGAGLMTAVGSLLTWLADPSWVFLPLFVGTGLTVAGATGFCGMALILQKMPWNRETPVKAATCGSGS